MDPLHFEKQAKGSGYQIIAGVDEAGRGPLAGPLIVAACILSETMAGMSGIRDSKKLSPLQREKVYQDLISGGALAFSIITVDVSTIDAINIFQATMLGMQKAVAALSICPDYVLVDGNKTPSFSIKAQALVNGDTLSYTIGAASILAKVTRDRLMEGYDLDFPSYGFAKHKGYPTKDHKKALAQFGPCPLHRRSYAPVKNIIIERLENT